MSPDATPADGPDPGPAEPSATAETHISVVVFLGDRAYKFPRPVRFAFLDQSSVERRAAVCAREVELNRRLAPDVYLGTGRLSLGSDVLEHCIVMRRMPPDRRLSALVDRSEAPAAVRAVARRLAAFHAGAGRSARIDEAGARASVEALWTDNLSELAGDPAMDGDRDLLEHIAERSGRYLAGRGPLLEQRRADGLIVDGHGDLLADDIFCLDDGPRILDCLAFSDRFRHGDVLADVAFLAMDLERRGAPELAAQLLDDYTEFSGEHHPTSLADHYIAYRALVRAKVASLRIPTEGAPAAREARSLLESCARHLDRAAVRLLVVGGPPGAGKSTLARGIGEARGWTVLSSDEVRKELGGRAWEERGEDGMDEGLYGPESTGATYRTLLERAERALGAGETVVLDASWARADDRSAASHLADATSSDLVEVRCHCPAEVAQDRVRVRRAVGRDASDADEEVARRVAGRFEAWASAQEVDTTVPPDRAVATALCFVDGSG